MFDFDATKLLIVGVIALICIPPKDLPRALRTAGQFVGKMRRMASEFQGQFMDAMREADMADLRREAQKLAESARVDTGLHDVEHTMRAKPRLADASGQGEAANGHATAADAAQADEPAPDLGPGFSESKPASESKAASAEPASHSA